MAKKKRKKSMETAGPPVAFDDKKWRSRSDYQTLCDAAEISRDRSRMSGAKAHAREQKDRASRIARLDGKLL